MKHMLPLLFARPSYIIQHATYYYYYHYYITHAIFHNVTCEVWPLYNPREFN